MCLPFFQVFLFLNVPSFLLLSEDSDIYNKADSTMIDASVPLLLSYSEKPETEITSSTSDILKVYYQSGLNIIVTNICVLAEALLQADLSGQNSAEIRRM